MKLMNKLKLLENQYAFLKWVDGSEYVKVKYVGLDFVEFEVIDIEEMEYKETLLLRPHLIMELTYGGADVQRVLAEMSCNLPSTLTNN